MQPTLPSPTDTGPEGSAATLGRVLLAAALVPDTALLVPGAAGRADPLRSLRREAVRAVGWVLAAAREADAGVLVVAPGRADAVHHGPLGGSLAGLGIPDRLLGAVPVLPAAPAGGADPVVGGPAAAWGETGPADPPRHGAAVASAVHLLHAAGHRGAVRAVEVAAARIAPGSPGRAQSLRERGAAYARQDLVLVVVGSGSARHGPDGPLADDGAAAALDEALARDLAQASPAARARLAAMDEHEAAGLAVTGWAPWQVLLGACGALDVRADLLAVDVSLGAWHAAALWRTRPVPLGRARP